MKSILSILLLSSIIIPSLTYAQNYGPSDIDPELEEQLLNEEASLAQTDESLGEFEQQEDVLHPEGETSDWSLGSEDLPSEEYE